jgi:hypothetical protein
MSCRISTTFARGASLTSFLATKAFPDDSFIKIGASGKSFA